METDGGISGDGDPRTLPHTEPPCSDPKTEPIREPSREPWYSTPGLLMSFVVG